MSFMEKETKRRNHSCSKTMDNRGEGKKRNCSLDYKNLKRYFNLIENTNVNSAIYNKYFKEKSIESIDFNDIYTQILKKIYPLIINPDHNHNQTYYCSHKKKISFFCFECHSHFCVQCQSNHKEHSFQSLEEIKINENVLNGVESSIEERVDLLFKDLKTKFNVKIYEKSKKCKEDIIKFNLYIIAKYKNEKNNFYNVYNVYYLFMQEKIKSNEIVKNFFSHYGFKTTVKSLKFFYEKQKIRWLLKNLVSYRKAFLFEEEKLKQRKANYKFENLSDLLTRENFDLDIIDMMDNIIKKTEKKGNNLKRKIFNFIIRAIDIYKKYPDRLLKDLKSIFEQMKFDFKQMVEEKVGYADENYKKFKDLEDCTDYKENNSNNEDKSEDIWNDELELYNDYFINDYKNTLILHISNSFIANNHNNKYVEEYPPNSKQRYDILSLMHNIDKTLEKKYSILLKFTNIIKANNHDFKYYKINVNRLGRGNNTKNNNIFNIDKNSLILYNCKNTEFRTRVKNIPYNCTDSYDFGYIREIGDLSQNMNIEEESVQKGDGTVIVKIINGDYSTNSYSGSDNFYNLCYHTSFFPIGCGSNYYPRETPEERKERIREEKEEKERERQRWKNMTPQEREEERKRIREMEKEEERKKREAEERRKREEAERKERERIAKLTQKQREEERKRKEEERKRKEEEDKKKREAEEKRRREEAERRRREEEERRRIEERNRRIRNGEICPYCYSSNIGIWNPGWRVFVGIITVGISEATIHKRKCYNCDSYFSADYE